MPGVSGFSLVGGCRTNFQSCTVKHLKLDGTSVAVASSSAKLSLIELHVALRTCFCSSLKAFCSTFIIKPFLELDNFVDIALGTLIFFFFSWGFVVLFHTFSAEVGICIAI